MIDRLRCGDLVVIRDLDVIESFVHATANTDGELFGIAMELCEADPNGDVNDDVWAVLVSGSMFHMLRREFDIVARYK